MVLTKEEIQKKAEDYAAAAQRASDLAQRANQEAIANRGAEAGMRALLEEMEKSAPIDKTEKVKEEKPSGK